MTLIYQLPRCMAHNVLPADSIRKTPIKVQKGRPMLPSGPIYHLVQTYDTNEWTTIGIRLRTWLTLTQLATQARLLTHLTRWRIPLSKNINKQLCNPLQWTKAFKQRPQLTHLCTDQCPAQSRVLHKMWGNPAYSSDQVQVNISKIWYDYMQSPRSNTCLTKSV